MHRRCFSVRLEKYSAPRRRAAAASSYLCRLMNSFETLGLSAPLLRAVAEMGYEAPMPVQREVIPLLLSDNQDTIALAQTGTGKTAAFGLPLLERTDCASAATQALVLAPTRELCLQIAADLKDYGRYLDHLRVVPVYGGSSVESQMRALGRGAQIVVATPGRLIDLVSRGAARLEGVRRVVLDEADEMLNMGFSESIAEIFSFLPAEHSTLLFSATMSREVERAAEGYLRAPRQIVIGSRGEGAAHVTHTYYMVHARDKYAALKRLVDYHPRIYAIIFCRTRLETQEVADRLIRDGYNAEALHGELSQTQRDQTMQKFRAHRTQLLVATDVAARGLDVDDLTHVVNYGLPDDVESYTHRSGRTGRAGKRGASLSIVHLRERRRIRLIEQAIGKRFDEGTLPAPQEICTKQLYRVIDELERTEVDEEQIAPFMPETLRKLDWLTKEDIIKRLVGREFGRFLAYYASAPAIEPPAARSSAPSGGPGSARRARGDHRAEAGYRRLFINLGKRDNFYAREIINLVGRYTSGRVDIGRIDLLPRCSFFEVPEAVADDVKRAMRRAKVGQRRVVVDEADPADGTAPAARRKAASPRDAAGPDTRRKAPKQARHDGRAPEAPANRRKGRTRAEWLDLFDD